MSFIRKWELTICTLFVLICGTSMMLLPELPDRRCGAVIILALSFLWVIALLISVSRLIIAVCRKKLSSDAHADAVLTLVIDSLLLLLSQLTLGPIC